MKRILLIILVTFAMGTAAQATINLTLNPVNGIIQGNAGQTIGWGFTLTNTTANTWVLVTASGFCQGTGNTAGSLSSSNCSPTGPNPVGSYLDFVGPQSPVVGPSSGPPDNNPNGGPMDMTMLTESFNNGMMTGTGSFTIKMNALSGLMTIGQLVITYDLYSRSPNNINFDPTTDLISTANFFAPNAEVDVVPEPGTWLLLGSTLAGLGLARFRRKKSEEKTC